jgi:hypothetical protein
MFQEIAKVGAIAAAGMVGIASIQRKSRQAQNVISKRSTEVNPGSIALARVELAIRPPRSWRCSLSATHDHALPIALKAESSR